jgi:hypothetical protein
MNPTTTKSTTANMPMAATAKRTPAPLLAFIF